MDEVFESDSDEFESSGVDDLEKLIRLEKAKKRKKLKVNKDQPIEESKEKAG